MTLADLQPGTVARISRLHLEGLERRRLMDLGFTPGAEVRVAMRAAFGDPIAFEVRNTRVALRKKQAQAIDIEPIS